MFVGVMIFAVFLYGGYMEISTPGGVAENDKLALLIGLAIIALLGLDAIAVGLGIAGLFQPDRKRVFSILGLVFATSTIIGTVVLIVIGNSL